MAKVVKKIVTKIIFLGKYKFNFSFYAFYKLYSVLHYTDL